MLKAYFTHADPIVPMQHPNVLVALGMDRGASLDALLENTQITPAMLTSTEARISYAQFGILARNALALTGNPALGLELGRRMHTGNLGVLGLAIMTSATVGAALEVGLRYYKTVAPGWDLTLVVEGQKATLVARPAINYGPMTVMATEALLAAFEAQGRFLVGASLPILAVRIAYAEPGHSGRYVDLTDAPVSFGHEVTEVDFDAEILERRLQWSDPVTARQAERQCAAALPDSGHADGLVARVRRQLSSSRGNYPTEPGLAQALRTTPRTLRRGLQRMRTSYQTLLDDDRRQHALALLQTTSLTAEDIARRLGFSDVRSFRRAFKRWTGNAPSAYRNSRPPTAIAS
jgi:AraC-like DNA-binding protein